MTINTILFDVGGVIVVPLDPLANAQRRDRLASRLGFEGGAAMWNHFFESDAWEAAKTGAMVHEEMWQALLTPLGLTSPHEHEAFVSELYADEGMLPAMRSLIQRLRPDFRLGILSNWDDRLEEILEERMNIAHYFDAILNSHRLGVAKPDEKAFRMALARLEAMPQEVLFIDDLARNTKAAGALGFQTHHYRDFTTLEEDLRRLQIID
jgi:epoxide hydrolase-like predicted phosphatase